jgi:uncharacterized membrane protein YedE/YeeE
MEMTMKPALGILLAVLVFSSPVAAQMAGLDAGARVRVTSPRDDLKKHVGTVMEVRGDSVVVASRDGTRSIALENVTALDVSTGVRTQVRRSALIGFGAGALVGGIAGAVSYAEPDLVFNSAAELGAVSALFFGGIGMVAGAVVGALQRTDRWERRDLPVKAAIGGSRSGVVTLSLSRTF